MIYKIRIIGLVFASIIFLTMALNVWGQEREKKHRPGFSETPIILQGTIRVSGAWALYPMMVKWGEEYRKVHPKVRVDISAGGAGKGVVDALAGLVNVGMVSREITLE